ncbi:MAG: ATP-dependent helicase [Gemmatimonadota bacterium]|nr:ATP-dependent helicase [Gemmatimonadota bacterium]
MRADPLASTLRELSAIQQRAVEWHDGPLLVLAGPGSGKTRVLTCRIARILDQSPDERFRVLALTFTTKAAHEMTTRVAALTPGLEERADIHTFHGFCAGVLRQHGVHLGIKPDFAIYSNARDRRSVLQDALARGTSYPDRADQRLLPRIDYLKARLVGADQAEEWCASRNGTPAREAARIARAYRLYEDELRRSNALDYNSLILEAHKLMAFPAMARHYRTMYRHWLFDEFQDTNGSQYKLLRRMAGSDFRRIFAVADDDQTIYEWNGASIRRIGDLVRDFGCEVVQLPTNYRCPPPIVEAGNRLVVYNARRRMRKRPAEAARPTSSHGERHIQCREFETDHDEATGIAAEIAALDATKRAGTLVLARTRALLESMQVALKEEGVPATLLARRDDFVSPQMRWMVACLRQLARPVDRRNMAILVDAFQRFAQVSLDLDDLLFSCAAEGVTPLSAWTRMVQSAGLRSPVSELANRVAGLASGEARPATAIEEILDLLGNHESDENLKDDLSAWRRLSGEIRREVGPAADLGRFLQELDLRSKEPPPAPGSVSLATIHGAKGLESDRVHLIGIVEGILPSWHSVNADGVGPLEEERRSCFVAVTRTKQRLVLSWARRYGEWPKAPSRFLEEMGLFGRECRRGPGAGPSVPHSSPE